MQNLTTSPAVRIRAFSLVELSIVLVILGLLVGGVLSGQSLIRAAELRKITTARSTYTSAMYSFRDKYFALPGDMTNATQFWGKKMATSCTSNSGAALNTASGTCDGDGNGVIDWPNATWTESARVWEQLSLAGLIPGKYAYSGTETGPGVSDPIVVTGVVGLVGYVNATAVQADVHGSTNFHLIRFGSTGPGGWYRNGIMAPDDAWSIDTKVDDGKAGRGKLLVSYNGSDPTVVPNRCVDQLDDPTANYNFQYSTKTCILNFVM